MKECCKEAFGDNNVPAERSKSKMAGFFKKLFARLGRKRQPAKAGHSTANAG